jgi:hypothetical protein
LQEGDKVVTRPITVLDVVVEVIQGALGGPPLRHSVSTCILRTDGKDDNAIALPSDLKGWNYVFFVFTISFLLGNTGFINAVGLRATGSTTSHYTT